jgi:hypothetical protein
MATPEQIHEFYQKNQALVERNLKIAETLQRVQAYIFVPKIRKQVFTQKFDDPAREQQIIEIHKMIYSIITDHLPTIVADTKTFMEDFNKSKGLFHQQKHYNEATNQIKNAIRNFETATEKLTKADEALLQLRSTDPQAVNKWSNKFFTEQARTIQNCTKDSIELLKKENDFKLKDFQGRLQVEFVIQQQVDQIRTQAVDVFTDLMTGDIVLSLKSNKYLKESLLSKSIARYTGSKITHAGIVIAAARDAEDKFPRLIDATDPENPMKVQELGLLPEEIWVVLRPRIDAAQRRRLKIAIDEVLKLNPKYSKKKLIGVGITGTLAAIKGKLTGKEVKMGNLFSFDKMNFFCSEFVNEMFKRAGFMLTPKSEHSNMVTPADIAASPMVDYVGLIFPKPKEEVSTEDVLNYFGQEVFV